MIVLLLVIVGLACGAVAIGYGVSYNRLVGRRNAVHGSWAAVEVELQRRHALVPALVEAVELAAVHERELLDELIRCNRNAEVAPHTAAAATHWEPPLAVAVHTVLALRERYPSLNAQQNFLALQHELTTIEDRLAAARRFYNHRVAQLNTAVSAFPSGLVARRHRIRPADFYDD